MLALVERHGFGVELLKMPALFIAIIVVLRTLRLAVWWYPESFRRLFATDDPEELGIRAAFALMLVFVGLSIALDVEPILGAFLAGSVFAIVFRSRGVARAAAQRVLVRFPDPDLLHQCRASLRDRLPRGRAASSPGSRVDRDGLRRQDRPEPACSCCAAFPLREILAAGVLLSARLSLIIAVATVGVELGLLSEQDRALAILLAAVSATVGPDAVPSARAAASARDGSAMSGVSSVHLARARSTRNAERKRRFSMNTRRTFLKEVAAACAVLPFAGWPSEAIAGSSPRPPRMGRPIGSLVRAQFSFREDKVPMNAANLCPSSRERLRASHRADRRHRSRLQLQQPREVRRAHGVLARQGGRAPRREPRRDRARAQHERGQQHHQQRAGRSRQATRSSLWDQNHPTNNVAWDVRAARFGLEVKRVSTPKHPKSRQELIDTFVSAIGPKTKVVTITHVSNLSGIRLPAKEIVEAAHASGIYVHLDGAQSWGALDVDLRDIGCDSLLGLGHKWFDGSEGGGRSLRQGVDNITRIWPNIVAPGWGDDADPDPRGARKFESLGQRDDACLAAVGTTVDFHGAIGAARIEARMMELATALKRRLASAGHRLVTPMDDRALRWRLHRRGRLASSDAPRVNRLYDEHGIAAASTGGLRICPHTYNTMEHVERAVAGVKALFA